MSYEIDEILRLKYREINNITAESTVLEFTDNLTQNISIVKALLLHIKDSELCVFHFPKTTLRTVKWKFWHLFVILVWSILAVDVVEGHVYPKLSLEVLNADILDDIGQILHGGGGTLEVGIWAVEVNIEVPHVLDLGLEEKY